VLRVLKIDIGFLYQKQNAFNNGVAKLKLRSPALADYIETTRTKWSERLTICRTGLEHGTWVLPKVRYACDMFVVGADFCDFKTGDFEMIREYMRPIPR